MIKNNDELIAKLKEDMDIWENQEIEFVEDFPKNGHDLTKDIAAFLTSNTARIYLGIGNDKTPIGLSTDNNIVDAMKKDIILDRLGNLVAKNIRPSIRLADIKTNFIDYNGKVILRIDVPKGIEPIYLSSNVAYVRNLTKSDQATPDQIKAFHLEYFMKQGFLKRDTPYLWFHIKYWYNDIEGAKYGIYVRNFGNDTAASYNYRINGIRGESSLPLISLKEEHIKNIKDDELRNGISVTEINWKDTHGREGKQKDFLLKYIKKL